jgi:hypothetical protein
LFFEKQSSGLITKNAGFFPSVFFSFSLGCFARFDFYRVFGRFVTRGVQKRDKKNRVNIFAATKKSAYLLASRLFVTPFFCHAAPL